MDARACVPKFKHGTHIHKDAYPRISAGPCRRKLVHTLVAEAMLRRELRKDEHVHHIDGDTKNPRWDNLLILGKDVHDAVSNRQYWYLKQQYAKERAAWCAFFDITGETPEDAKARQFAEVSFDVATM